MRIRRKSTFEKRRVINMTPHTISVYSGDDSGDEVSHTYPPSGETLEMDIYPTDDGFVRTYEIEKSIVPDELDNVVYIASLSYLIALQAADIYRDDIVAPDTNTQAVRDEKGEIIGVRGFMRLW